MSHRNEQSDVGIGDYIIIALLFLMIGIISYRAYEQETRNLNESGGQSAPSLEADTGR